MRCYECGVTLSEKDYCTGCGVDVGLYKKIQYMANLLYNEGLEKAKVRDLSGAIVCLRQCLKFSKSHVDARNLLGLVYFERGDMVAALSEWVISCNFRSTKNVASDYLAMIQSNQSRRETMNQAIKKYNIALGYCYQDGHDLAVIQLKKVLGMNPKLLEAHQLLALLYIRGEEWDKAHKELQKCIKIDMGNTRTLRYLKEVENAMAMPVSSEEGRTFGRKKEAVTIQHGNETIIQPVGGKDRSWLTTIWNIVLGIALGLAVAYFLIVPAKLQQSQSNTDESVKVMGEQLDSKTSEIARLEKLVEELQIENEQMSAELTAYEGVSLDTEQTELLLEAWNAYAAISMEEQTQEQKDANLFLTIETLAKMDMTYLAQDSAAQLQQAYDHLLRIAGGEAAAIYYDTGYEAYREGDYELAIAKLEYAVYCDPTNGYAWYSLGKSYREVGEYAEAIEAFTKVIETAPGSERARQSQGYIDELSVQS